MIVGTGYDLHKLTYGRRLIIGGVHIPCDFGSIAHSDGDILIHSLIDALLTPFHTNIGILFPDNSDKYKDVSSLLLLKEIKEKFLKEIKILSIDNIVILDKPKINNYILDMRKNIANTLEIDINKVYIKPKTSEGTKINCIECFSTVLIDI